MPMLDELEFAQLDAVYRECFTSVKSYRAANEATLAATPIDELFARVTAEYERLTGYAGMHHNAAMHHRLALYGPPCRQCGKPLRTPRATFCAACGARRT